MFLCYMDESGNTGDNLKDVHQPYLVLTGLVVPAENIKEIEDDVRTLGYRHFAAESRNTDFEFHGDHIYNGRGRYYKKLNLKERIELLDDIVNLIIKQEAIKLGYISIKKEGYYGRLHIQQTAFCLLVEKLEAHLQGHMNSYCLLIADEQDELEQKLIDDLDLYKQRGTSFGYKSVNVDKIIDSVHFVQSNNNYLMQLSDVACYLIRKGKEAQVKLLEDYRNYEGYEDTSFQDWLETNSHKGRRFFYKTYRRINSSKPWLFSKDFP